MARMHSDAAPRSKAGPLVTPELIAFHRDRGLAMQKAALIAAFASLLRPRPEQARQEKPGRAPHASARG